MSKTMGPHTAEQADPIIALLAQHEAVLEAATLGNWIAASGKKRSDLPVPWPRRWRSPDGVEVRHVHIYPGGQGVVGIVNQKTGEEDEK